MTNFSDDRPIRRERADLDDLLDGFHVIGGVRSDRNYGRAASQSPRQPRLRLDGSSCQNGDGGKVGPDRNALFGRSIRQLLEQDLHRIRWVARPGAQHWLRMGAFFLGEDIEVCAGKEVGLGDMGFGNCHFILGRWHHVLRPIVFRE
jgi:hypothetical protein